MNKVILMGRLTRDVELKQTQSGTAVANFTIAVNRRFVKEGQQNADFINCTAWRGTAEFIAKHFCKGSMISVVGNLQSRSWEDQDGKKQFATDVSIDEAYFTGEKKETPTQGNFGGNTPAETVDLDGMEFTAVAGSEDDLPF